MFGQEERELGSRAKENTVFCIFQDQIQVRSSARLWERLTACGALALSSAAALVSDVFRVIVVCLIVIPRQ